MPFILAKTFPRLWSLEAGMAMVVTDLHGDWDAYQRYRDRFVALQAEGRVDCLIFTGDLIHGERSAETDKSLEIVLDVLSLRAVYGSAIIYLCGNHEMPHIYGIGLARGEREYTPDFEVALSRSGRRAEVMALFESLPFFVRSRAGVSLTHAGGFGEITEPKSAGRLFNLSHRKLLAWAQEALAREDVVALRQVFARLNQSASYEALAEYYLAVFGPDDPRYDNLLRGFLATAAPSFELLWSALFTRCEDTYGKMGYPVFLAALLKELSVDYVPQEVLVSGHMGVPSGHKNIAHRQLRLASGVHASPRKAGQYLIFDASRSIHSVGDLLAGLGSVY
jgi:Icc-related predicted phosphoesterase